MMKHIGAHVSANAGVENAPINANAIGADAFALFTKINDVGSHLHSLNKVFNLLKKIVRSLTSLLIISCHTIVI